MLFVRLLFVIAILFLFAAGIFQRFIYQPFYLPVNAAEVIGSPFFERPVDIFIYAEDK